LTYVTRIVAQPVSELAEQFFVRMRDGVRLATDVYLPDRGLPTQAVLVRLPYDKCSRYVFFQQAAPWFTERGYALVVQDVRGKFRSGGETVPRINEAADGYDTIDWIVGQPWCDGNVGMFGDSYYGFTQWAAVASGHPALRAIVPRLTMADQRSFPGRHTVGARDVVALELLEVLASYWVDQDAYEFEPDWEIRPLVHAFDRGFDAIGRRAAAFDMAVPYPTPRRDWPTVHPFDTRGLPVLHVAGWFDTLLIPSMDDYTTLSSRPGWAPLQYLSVDAVDHENHHLSQAPIADHDDHNASEEALARLLPRYLGPALDFFDVFVRRSSSVDTLARVSWHLGHDGWRTATGWPPPGAAPRRLYLSDGAGPHDGRLTTDMPRRSEVAWVHDPDALVPSAARDSITFLARYPDERATGEREDVLVFSGPEVTEPMDLAGPIELRLTLASTAPTTDVFVKVMDVDPDGAARMIARGQRQFDVSPDPVSVVVALGHTGYRLRSGHRLRVHLSGSDFPLFLPNPGTGENPWLATRTARSRQTISLGGDSPSWLTVTVLE
jgi:uncharacterized protein